MRELWFGCFTVLGAVPTGMMKICLSDDDVDDDVFVAIVVTRVAEGDEKVTLELAAQQGITIPFFLLITLEFITGTGLRLVRDGEMSLDDLSLRPLNFIFVDFEVLPRAGCLPGSYKNNDP